MENGPHASAALSDATEPRIYFRQDGICRYAGLHLLLEFWEAELLDDAAHGRKALLEAVRAAGCTLLDISLHSFSPGNGFSGVAVLSESHISIHTWPELNYAAIDIFTCGSADPHAAIPPLKAAFRPRKIQMSEHRRGMLV
jgi:S-adenosylmethionine decarboxylase